MSKWINVTGKPGDAWEIEDYADLNAIMKVIAGGEAATFPLKLGGTLVVNGKTFTAFAVGEDKT